MKKCLECGMNKEDEEFHCNGVQPSGLKKYKPVCRACYSMVRLRKHWNRIESIVGAIKCSVCGYDRNTSAIEFHHTAPGKEFPINQCKTRNIDTLRRELKKCIMVCANCHREIHHPQ